nr:MFS transporter [Limnochorda pilosa]
MARWTLMSAVGDLLSPLAVAAAVTLHVGWRSLFWLAALLWLGMAGVLWPQRFPPRGGDRLSAGTRLEETGGEADVRSAEAALAGEAGTPGDSEPVHGILGNLWMALRQRSLSRWIGVILAADMLDEVFLGFAALYLRDVVGVDAAALSLALGAQMTGGVIGLVVLERTANRFSAGQRLRGLAWVVLLTFAGLLSARSVWTASAALFAIGLGAAGWYPVAKAVAYEALPGRSGTVRAAVDIFATPFNAVLPAVVGAVAGGFGLLAGVGLLGLAPVVVLGLVGWYRDVPDVQARGQASPRSRA